MVYAVNLYDEKINPTAKFGDFASILNLVIPLITIAAGVVFLAMLLYGAFVMITAGGNPDNVKKAQKIFTYSVIGLFIVLFAYGAVQLIAKMFGLDKIPL